MPHAGVFGATPSSRGVACLVMLLFALAGAPALADDDDDDHERGPKVKIDDDGKEYKYEYEDGRCKYKYELKYRTGEEKLEKKGNCHGVGPNRAVYYSGGAHRRPDRDSAWHHERERQDRDYDETPYGSTGRLSCHREVAGQVLGGVAGGVLGAQVGDGSGRRAATIAGTIVGVMIGGNIGRGMDRSDTACAYQAFEFAESDQTVAWHNPNSQLEYGITPGRLVRHADGRKCRAYRMAVSGVERGSTEGRSCRRSDGSWEIVSR